MNRKMEAIQLADLREGDEIEVSIPGVVAKRHPERIEFQPVATTSTSHWEFNNIELAAMTIRRAPRPLAAGDQVQSKMYGCANVVVAVDGNEAWIKPESGGLHHTVNLDDLVRA